VLEPYYAASADDGRGLACIALVARECLHLGGEGTGAVIASSQPKALKDSWLEQFQLWELYANPEGMATIVCSPVATLDVRTSAS
jgi:hypothetical protein